MNSRKSDTERLARLRAALKRARPDDFISQQVLIALWGSISNAGFTQMKSQIIGWPDSIKGAGANKLYPAKVALKLLIDADQRSVKIAQQRRVSEARILGSAATAHVGSEMSLNDLAKLSRLATEVEERERAQGLFVPVAQNAALAGRVFNLISGYLSHLESKIDPSGLYPTAVRASLNEAGKELLLKMHAEMRDTLSGDAKPLPAARPGKKARGRPRTRT